MKSYIKDLFRINLLYKIDAEINQKRDFANNRFEVIFFWHDFDLFVNFLD